MQKLILCLTIFVALISLSAQSGDPRSVTSVDFIGNHSFNHRQLKGQVSLKPSSLLLFSRIEFDRRLLKLDAIAIKNYYHSNGFLETIVKDSFSVSEPEVAIYFLIDEGKQYFLSSVTMTGLKTFKEKEILTLLGLKLDRPYNPVQINTNLALVDEAFQDKGKLFAQLDIQQEIQDSVFLSLKVNFL